MGKEVEAETQLMQPKASTASFRLTAARQSGFQISMWREKPSNFLEVKLDRNLFFGLHAEEVSLRMTKKRRIIGAVSNTDWGWKKEYLYMALIDSIPKYAAFAWLPCAARTHIERVKRAQNRALGSITGQYMATPVAGKRTDRLRNGHQEDVGTVGGESCTSPGGSPQKPVISRPRKKATQER